MNIDLGFGDFIDLGAFDIPTARIKVWFDFLAEIEFEHSSQPQENDVTLNSDWMSLVTKPVMQRQFNPKIVNLRGDRVALVFSVEREGFLVIQAFLKLWGYFFQYFTEQSHQYKWDHDFEPIVIDSTDRISLLVTAFKVTNIIATEYNFELSDWSFAKFSLAYEWNNQFFTNSSSLDIQNSVAALLNLISANQNKLFIRSGNILQFIYFLMRHCKVLGFQLEQTLSHEDINLSNYFFIFTCSDRLIKDIKLQHLGYSLKKTGIFYRKHHWDIDLEFIKL